MISYSKFAEQALYMQFHALTVLALTNVLLNPPLAISIVLRHVPISTVFLSTFTPTVG
jgi:hypothetical protein